MELTEYARTHAAGMSQKDLARQIGISRSYLAEILSGAKIPGRDAIGKIERATDGKVPASVWFSRPKDAA